MLFLKIIWWQQTFFFIFNFCQSPSLLTRINFLLLLLFCPRDSLLTAKWKPIRGANKPAVSIASRMSWRPKVRYAVNPIPVIISIQVHVQSCNAMSLSLVFLVLFLLSLHASALHGGAASLNNGITTVTFFWLLVPFLVHRHRCSSFFLVQAMQNWCNTSFR